MNKILLFFFGTTVLVALWVVPALAAPVTVGGDHNFPPFEYLNDKGVPEGFNIDIIMAVSRAMDMGIKIELGPWNQVRTALERGETEVLAGMYRTPQRAEKVDFAVPHYISTYSVFVRNGSPIKGIDQCRGKRIGLQKGDLYHDIAVERQMSTRLVLEDDLQDVIENLAQGRVDCAVISRAQGMQIAKNMGIQNIRPLSDPILQGRYCIAVAQGNANLLAMINEGLFIIKTSGEFDAIYEKWFGALKAEPLTFATVLRKGIWVILPLLGLVAAGFVWSLMLLRQIKGKTARLSDELAERTLAEQRLKKSEEEIKSIFRAVPTGIGVVCDRKIIQANEQLARVTGFSRDELIGQSARLLYPNEARYDHVGLEKYQQIDQVGIGTVETQWQRKDGRLIDVLLSSTPIDLEDLSRGVTFAALDITDLKAKESQLLESEKKYQAIMGSMKEPVYITSEDYLIEYMNPTMIQRTGYDATGEDCFTAIHGFSERCPWCEFDTIKNGSTQEMDIVSFKDNHSFHVSATPIAHANGTVSMLNVLRDTTRMKQIEAQLQQAQKLEAVGVLAGGIAHDFNNILSGIFGYSKLAERHIDNPTKAKSHIRQIIKGSQRAAELIQQILAFSRKTEPKMQVLILSTVVKEILDLIRSSIPSSIVICEKIVCEKPILGDPVRIHQALMNLCTNAFQAMVSTGVLTVEVDMMDVFHSANGPIPNMVPGQYLTVKVMDTGNGMDPKTLNKIFDPYFTTKKPGEGTGLGLALVYGVVEEHGGYVTVDSGPGQGSAFQLFFPVVDERAGNQIEVPNLQEVPPGGREHIMVVDDEESILLSTQELLKDYGYEITAFENSADAYAEFEKDPLKFDLVITDMTMPQLSGVELSTKMLNLRSELPIILCTGYCGTYDEKKALALGVKKYVQKPIDSRTLLGLIRELIHGN
ncbi:predicted fusion protein, periplasmic substrate-binding protein (N-terminal) / sensory box regulatory protein (C-terminal) [Desulforapulum autotrophicum HRM2]|uniref:histidine kinase n=1 Tax=Desulforapulum autotrophicum (strain ATCC 43914 / DSM 3382 / VKM B-1955 / HRM2) TaxID=177437 RepID=C0QLM8_DESAH|nr:transporter substrate-binding domain-containing protein [Desulforapulum autotrophicum]ACN16332.1 predicted fusion protein, periplasmic substrate-binding protein (N-terminal) / sensory box regulatory protein (C-terminal) [Desulforapulum autotrophicum HRM2]